MRIPWSREVRVRGTRSETRIRRSQDGKTVEARVPRSSVDGEERGERAQTDFPRRRRSTDVPRNPPAGCRDVPLEVAGLRTHEPALRSSRRDAGTESLSRYAPAERH